MPVSSASVGETVNTLATLTLASITTTTLSEYRLSLLHSKDHTLKEQGHLINRNLVSTSLSTRSCQSLRTYLLQKTRRQQITETESVSEVYLTDRIIFQRFT